MFCIHSYYNYNNLLLKIKSNQESLNLNFNSIDKLKIKKDNSYIIFQRNNSDLSVFLSQSTIGFLLRALMKKKCLCCRIN